MKSENNKKNHKNYQNQGPRAMFSKYKDPIVLKWPTKTPVKI
jgi:hypothetical protein